MHRKDCQLKYVECTQGCGLALQAKDLQYHEKMRCVNFYIDCSHCHLSCQPYKSQHALEKFLTHDCQHVEMINKHLYKVSFKWFKVINIKCKHGCNMDKLKAYHGETPQCNQCQMFDPLIKGQYYYHCNKHHSVTCVECAFEHVKKIKYLDEL